MKRLLLPMLLLNILVWSGCGGGGKSSTSSTAVTITISPTAATVQGGQTQQFTATLTNTTNMGVTWEVNGTAGGNAVVGTITTTGLYTAPLQLPSPANVTVTAVAQADTTQSAMATVTLTTPTIVVMVSPSTATLAAGATQQFGATVTGNSNTAVNWTVNGVAGGNPTLGTVDATGLYTAPASPPKEGITVFAVSQADGTTKGAATVTAEFGNASLNGTYVFLLTQPDINTGTGFAFRGGTLVFDGAGDISAGVEDENSSGAGPMPNVAFTGTYTVGPDGRGMATINDPSARKFSFALISSTRGQLISFDNSPVPSGFIQQQDQTAIANAKGTFVFSFFGDNAGPVAQVGDVVLDGAGNITSGSEDTNSHGVVTQNVPIVGTYSLGAAGHGTATIGTAHFAFYIIDASTLAFLGTDPTGLRVAGSGFAQTGGPFTAANLGTSVFLVNGNAVSGNAGFAQAGEFSTDGASSLNSGVFDQNNAGTLTIAAALTGTYTLASTGRGQLSFNNQTFIFWLTSPTKAVLIEADGVATAGGLLLKQTGQPFSSGVAGGYVFALAGSDAANTNPFAIDGQLSTTGFGILAGNADVNEATLQPAQQSLPLSGNLALSSNGRGTGSIKAGTTLNYDFYFASPDQFFLISADPKTVLSGMAHRQCSDCE